MKTNCPNCGAPIDYAKEKCEYCGTWYDFSPYSYDGLIEVTAATDNFRSFIEAPNDKNIRVALKASGEFTEEQIDEMIKKYKETGCLFLPEDFDAEIL